MSDDLEGDPAFRQGTLVANYEPIQKRLRDSFKTTICPPEIAWLYYGNLSKLKDGSLRLHDGELRVPISLLGIPEHSNMGDHCIAEETVHYIQSVIQNAYIIQVTEEELVWRQFDQLNNVPPFIPVFLQGGGNLGNLWPGPESIRERVIEGLPNNPVIIMPQSIWFTDDQEGHEALERAQKIYRGDHILLCCREAVSFTFAKKYFACQSILVPDQVMWRKKEPARKLERFGALTLLRKDIERKMTDEDKKYIELFLTKRFGSVEVSDTVWGSVSVNSHNRTEQIEKLVSLISSAECVITDRLHGMILCAATGTPCVVFRNGYPKVAASYEWLKDLKYIRLVENTGELADAVESVCGCQERDYPEKQMQDLFTPLTELIRIIMEKNHVLQ